MPEKTKLVDAMLALLRAKLAAREAVEQWDTASREMDRCADQAQRYVVELDGRHYVIEWRDGSWRANVVEVLE